jgi:hypothetical protein
MSNEALLKVESIAKSHKTRIKVFGREDNIKNGKSFKYSTCI